MGLLKMQIAGGKSITVNSPMRRLFLTASFVALKQAVQFAEQIIEKYDKPEESTQFGEPLVFLKNLNSELERAGAVRNEYLLTVRLMIARQLSLSGRFGRQNKEYSTTVEHLIDSMSANLRSYDPVAWGRLCELRKVIEQEEHFAEAVSAETVRTGVDEAKLLKVEAASLIRAIDERADENSGREIQASDLFGPFSGGELLFRTRDFDGARDRVANERADEFFEKTEKNVSGTKEFDRVGATDRYDRTIVPVGDARTGGETVPVVSDNPAVAHEEGNIGGRENTGRGDAIRVSSEEYGYDSERLVLRNNEDADNDEQSVQAAAAETALRGAENYLIKPESVSRTGESAIGLNEKESHSNNAVEGKAESFGDRNGTFSDDVISRTENRHTVSPEVGDDKGERAQDDTQVSMIAVSPGDYGYEPSSLVFKDDSAADSEDARSGVGTQQTGTAFQPAVVSRQSGAPQSGVVSQQSQVVPQQSRSESQLTGVSQQSGTASHQSGTVSQQSRAESQPTGVSRQSGTESQPTGVSRQSGAASQTGNAADGLLGEAPSSGAVPGGNRDMETTDPAGEITTASAHAVVAEPIEISSRDYRYDNESLVLREENTADPAGGHSDGISQQTETLTDNRENGSFSVRSLATPDAESSETVSGTYDTSADHADNGKDYRESAAASDDSRQAAADETVGSATGDAITVSPKDYRYDPSSLVFREESATGNGEAHQGSVSQQVSRTSVSGDAGDVLRRDSASTVNIPAVRQSVAPVQIEETDIRSAHRATSRGSEATISDAARGNAQVENGERDTHKSEGAGVAHREDGRMQPSVGTQLTVTSTHADADDQTGAEETPRDNILIGDAIRVSDRDYRYDIETFVHKENAADHDPAQGEEPTINTAHDSVHVVRTGDGVTISQGSDSVRLSVNGDALTVTHGSESVRVPITGSAHVSGTGSGVTADATSTGNNTSAGSGTTGGDTAPENAFSEDSAADAGQGITGVVASANAGYRVADLIYRNSSTASADESINPIGLNSYLTEGARYFTGLINKRSLSALRAPAQMTTLGGSPVAARAEATPGSGDAGSGGEYRDTAPLSYRTPPHTAEPVPPQQGTVNHRAGAPSTDTLVRQFGNLIDGADPTGLTADFGSTPIQRSDTVIRELVTAVKNAAEQSAVNSKMIEEIRKKQTEMETGTLKTSDMRVISDEVITRLRSELRFDRSRYSG